MARQSLLRTPARPVFDIEISDLDLPYYLAYVPIQMKMKILSAFLDVKGKVTFIQQKGKPPSANTIRRIGPKENCRRRSPAESPFTASPFGGFGRLRPPAAQVLSSQKNFHPLPGGGDPARSARRSGNPIPDPKPEDEKTPVKSEPETSPLSLEIDEIEMTGGKLTFTDLSRKKPFQTVLSPIEAKIENFSNGKDKKSNYTLVIKTEAKEEIQLAGGFSVVPLQGSGKVEIKGVPAEKIRALLPGIHILRSRRWAPRLFHCLPIRSRGKRRQPFLSRKWRRSLTSPPTEKGGGKG